MSPALLHAVTIGKKSNVLKELQPMTDRLDLARWDGRIERLELAVASMAAATAWAQLRVCYRYGASPVDDLQRYVAGSTWQRALSRLASQCGERALQQWSAYCTAYDADGIVPLVRESARRLNDEGS
jgi:uncharacterized protein (DUF2252 family)